MWDLDIDADYIENVVGVKTRHFAEEGTATSHMAAEACKEAMEKAKVSPDQLDRIILGTGTADYTSLAAAGRIQSILGATCPAEDTINACASFIYALDRAVRLIATGCEYILVAGGDIKSRFLTKKDTRFVPVFGDGAGAVVLAPCDKNEGFMEIALWQDGNGIDKLNVPAGGSLIPPTHKTLDDGLHGTIMTIDSKEFLVRAVEVMKKLGTQVCQSYGIKTFGSGLLRDASSQLICNEKSSRSIRDPIVENGSHYRRNGKQYGRNHTFYSEFRI